MFSAVVCGEIFDTTTLLAPCSAVRTCVSGPYDRNGANKLAILVEIISKASKTAKLTDCRAVYGSYKESEERGQPRPQGLLLVQNGGRRNPAKAAKVAPKSSSEFRHANTMKCLRFV